MAEFINFINTNNTGIIILERPKVLNALNLKMAISIKKKLIQWKNNKNIRRIIIKGTGKAFCAGGDIKSICLAKKKIKFKKKFF